MSLNPQLTSYHTPKVRELLKNAVAVGCSVAITRTRGGICVGFAEKYIPRGGFDHKHAGTYIDFATAIVKPEDGGPVVAVPLNLGSVTEIADICIRIGDLPDCRLWEGDTVIFTGDLSRDHSERDYWTVMSIDYSAGKSTKNCTLRSCHDSRVAKATNMDRVVLMARGNLWKMEHGEPMEFATIEAEGLFYKSLGMSHKLSYLLSEMRPKDSRMSAPRKTDEYELADAVRKIQNGEADQMKCANAKKLTYVLIWYKNREFGERMRAHTLAKLNFAE